jgi:aminoglycoside phosphotransferase (APT) family kinase protein
VRCCNNLNSDKLYSMIEDREQSILSENKLIPRACYLTEQMTIEAQHPLVLDRSMVSSLIEKLAPITGNIFSLVPMKENSPALVLLLEAEQGAFVLKVAQGTYRSQELWAEHVAMQQMYGSSVVVPEPLLYRKKNNLSFQLRRYIRGASLNSGMTDDSSRLEMIRQMGKLLASIHKTTSGSEWGWQEWVDSSLKLAAGNLAAGVYDTNEFTTSQPPAAALDWLKSNRPLKAGSVCLVHGDYRPKNIVWINGKITGVIDWQFVDFGDPYYDISVIRWYMRSEVEWQQFCDGYGLIEFDNERFEYCLMLQKFLNV